MEKIQTLFVRDWEGDRSLVTQVVEPRLEKMIGDPFVVARRKYDGTCVMLDEGGRWFARREVKGNRTPPTGYVPLTITEDGGSIGWEPIASSPFHKFHEEARRHYGANPQPGTYELCGPKIQKNPEGYGQHHLLRHDAAPIADTDMTFGGLRDALIELQWEGFVFYDASGPVAKIKLRDFGHRRQPK